MSAHDIVGRLEFCRQVKEGEWMARCPGHDDRGPSLSIKDAGGGRTLIHCFAGCGAAEVLEAIGMDMGDLYPPTDRDYKPLRERRERTVDELVLEIARADRAAGKTLSPADLDREAIAFARVVLGEPCPGDSENMEAKFMAFMERKAGEVVL